MIYHRNPLISTLLAKHQFHDQNALGFTGKKHISGNILRLEVKTGDQVIANQTLLVMEAMKMESEVKAHAAGTVVELHVSDGDTVQAGTPLLSLSC